MDTRPEVLRLPMFISSRLMAAVRVGDSGATIHIEPTDRDDDGRMVWRYVIEDSGGYVLDDATGIRSGAGDPLDSRKTMATLLSFLGAAADSYRHTMTGGRSDNANMFPPEVMEWAYEHGEELTELAFDLEDPGPTGPRLRIVRRYFTDDDIHDGEVTYQDEEDETVDCQADDTDDGDTAVTLAAQALRDAGCTQPSSGPGPLGLADWWTDPDGSHIIDHTTGRRCETSAFPAGFTPDELNAINKLL
jgi:hypothetical protein